MSVGIEPDPWQIEVLASDHPRKILLRSSDREEHGRGRPRHT